MEDASPPPANTRDGTPGNPALRQRIVAATIDVTATVGFPAARMEDIVATAGIGRRTFWKYFADKSAAFAAGYVPIVDDLQTTVQQGYVRESDPVRRVVACLTAIAGFLAADPVRADVLLIQGPCAGRAVVDVRVRTMRRLVELLATTVDQLDPPTALPPERRRLVVEGVAGGLHEVAYGRTFRGEVHRLPALVPELARLTLAPFLGPESAATAIAARCAV